MPPLTLVSSYITQFAFHRRHTTSQRCAHASLGPDARVIISLALATLRAALSCHTDTGHAWRHQ